MDYRFILMPGKSATWVGVCPDLRSDLPKLTLEEAYVLFLVVTFPEGATPKEVAEASGQSEELTAVLMGNLVQKDFLKENHGRFELTHIIRQADKVILAKRMLQAGLDKRTVETSLANYPLDRVRFAVERLEAQGKKGEIREPNSYFRAILNG